MVRKYGGSSLVTGQRIDNICKLLPETPMVIVLSAPFGRTNCLYESAQGIDKSEAFNHYIALGEQESCMRFKLGLEKYGKEAEIVPFNKTGITASHQHGGHIAQCEPSYIAKKLASGKTVIVAGFHASFNNKLAILSRGASDDTAVALAIALDLPCEIYSNVPFIYSPNGNKYEKIDYDTLINMITELQAPMSKSAMLLAKAHNKSLNFQHWGGREPGTLICDEDKVCEY